MLTISAGAAQWSGNHNLYSLTFGFAVNQPTYDLKTWQQRWDSDPDSRSGPPIYLDPQEWRIMAGPPKRPDGKDYGADVDNVARTVAP